jgi:uncharacterized protein (DUF2147 family)
MTARRTPIRTALALAVAATALAATGAASAKPAPIEGQWSVPGGSVTVPVDPPLCVCLPVIAEGAAA